MRIYKRKKLVEAINKNDELISLFLAFTTKIENEDDLCTAAAYDHVCAEYRNAHRSVEDFISADCAVKDAFGE